MVKPMSARATAIGLVRMGATLVFWGIAIGLLREAEVVLAAVVEPWLTKMEST